MNFEKLSKRINELENKVRQKLPHDHPQIICALKAVEELGEVSDLLVRKWVGSRKGKELGAEEFKQRLGEELSDVIIPLIQIATFYGIDLETAIEEKISVHFKNWD
ncbi:MAG: hypothetical protein GOU97_02875 [Nanoarchaeota archaeon]|nr:hypothetical protein [Nanoarchaeota archaeon]